MAKFEYKPSSTGDVCHVNIHDLSSEQESEILKNHLKNNIAVCMGSYAEDVTVEDLVELKNKLSG